MSEARDRIREGDLSSFLSDHQAQEIAAFERLCEEKEQARREQVSLLLYAVVTDRLAIPIRFLAPDKLSPDWFSPRRFFEPKQAIDAFLELHPDAVQVTREELEEQSWERLSALYPNWFEQH